MTFDRIALIAVVALAAGYGFVEHRAAAGEGAPGPINVFPASTGVPIGDGTVLVGAFVLKENGEVRFCQGTMESGKTPTPHLTCVPENQK